MVKHLDSLFVQSYELATNSPDPSTQNGAVLIGAHGDVIGVGWNDFPEGVNADHWNGDKEAKYARVVHAETSTLLDAARRGECTEGSSLVCAWAACSNCSKHIAAAGVDKLYRHKFSNNGVTTGNQWYDDCVIGDEIMREAGVEIIEVDPVPTRFVLRRNGGLWP